MHFQNVLGRSHWSHHEYGGSVGRLQRSKFRRRFRDSAARNNHNQDCPILRRHWSTSRISLCTEWTKLKKTKQSKFAANVLYGNGNVRRYGDVRCHSNVRRYTLHPTATEKRSRSFCMESRRRSRLYLYKLSVCICC